MRLTGSQRRTYTQTNTRTHTLSRKNTHAQTHTRKHTHTHKHTHVRTHTQTHSHARTHSRTHARTQTHAYTYTHTQACTLVTMAATTQWSQGLFDWLVGQFFSKLSSHYALKTRFPVPLLDSLLASLLYTGTLTTEECFEEA